MNAYAVVYRAPDATRGSIPADDGSVWGVPVLAVEHSVAAPIVRVVVELADAGALRAACPGSTGDPAGAWTEVAAGPDDEVTLAAVEARWAT